jgi:hypothetical protein
MVGFGSFQEFGYGISVYLQPEYYYVKYGAEDFAFGSRREDKIKRIVLGVYRRDWNFLGVTPTLTQLCRVHQEVLSRPVYLVRHASPGLEML